jgi:hypothetical protein
MYTVKHAQEEVLIIATGLSDLMVSEWNNKDIVSNSSTTVHKLQGCTVKSLVVEGEVKVTLASLYRKEQDKIDDSIIELEGQKDISSILCSILKILSVLGLPVVQVLKSKLEINNRKYPKVSCQTDTTIQRYTKYTGETGIKKDSDIFLFEDINAMMIPLEGFNTHAMARYNRNKIDFDSHFGSLLQEVTSFATDRNWVSNYTNESIHLSLLSELGELSSVLQWMPQNMTINDITVNQKDGLARELADLTIYLLHLCRTRNVAPVLCGTDVNEGVNHKGIRM